MEGNDVYNMSFVHFEQLFVDPEHSTDTLYFRASRDYLKASKRKYHDADSITISLEFPHNLIQARYAHAMFSPTKDGHDYDWNDVDIPNEHIDQLIDVYLISEGKIRPRNDVFINPEALCRSIPNPCDLREKIAKYINRPVNHIDDRGFYVSVKCDKDDKLMEVVKQMEKNDCLSVGFNCNGDMINIKNVIFNPPATIVMWSDDTKTVVKCREDLGEKYDPEKGLAMAIAKKSLGNTGKYYDVFKKWIPTTHKSDNQKKTCVHNDILETLINVHNNATECL